MKDRAKAKIDFRGILKNKYALVVLAVGLVLLLWPSGSKNAESGGGTDELAPPVFSVTQEEARLENQLSRIAGAGKVAVLLSVKGSASRALVEGENGALVVSENGRERVVELYYVNPEYRGAVIVCAGADSAGVRLKITKAVADFTGLGSDKISVVSMEK
ncbi:MAG: stage III sporulation protein AG [Oscillospiraceae bacterium]|jgi:stage III sporulation protein AG|nr:stage III sporulation protein AG [Oscillospiraceae bacterium]